jgi:predicted  nucleic acid-binding Zn-ribbon protein
MELWVTILGYVITPITGVVSYFAGRRKNNNDFLAEMQRSIDLLSIKNSELVEEVVKLRGEVVQLKSENLALRKEVEELNSKLENVKTITRTK